MRVAEHTTTIADVPVFYRSAGSVPIVYLHDALMSSDDVVAFLERTGGVAPDLIGFGRSGKGGHLDYSPSGLVEFVERFLAELGIEHVKLVGHGWGGAIALLLGMREPERLERLVLIDAVPLLPGFTWPRALQWWRRSALGELVMGSTTRTILARQLRKASTHPEASWSEARVGAVWEQFDQGTQRALLRLHRVAGEAWLAEAGRDLDRVDAPTLVVWGEADPWFSPRFADAYGQRLADARVERVPDAGHWPWRDRPGVLDLVAEFLAGQ